MPLFTPSNSTRKMLLFGFKNRTLKLDFYGLVKNSAHALPHLVSAPAWPGPAAQKQLCTSSAGSFSRDGVAGRFMSSALAEASSHGSQPQSSCSHIPCSSGWDVLCLLSYLLPSLLSHSCPLFPAPRQLCGGLDPSSSQPAQTFTLMRTVMACN